MTIKFSFFPLKVDVYDEGPYTCSIQTKQQPKTSQVYLIVQGKLQTPVPKVHIAWFPIITD